METVKLQTRDHVEIVGDYFSPAFSSEKGVLLLHMMPATRRSWDVFSPKLAAAGFHVLAIDYRGHGDSQGGPAGYKNFSDQEHQGKILDVKAAADFLSNKGVKIISLVGASIGANLSLHYLAIHPEAKSAILLSPGLNYKGIETEPLAKALHKGQGVFYVAAQDDTYSAQTIRRLHTITPDYVEKELKLFEAGGHGTTMFERHPDFMDVLIAWLLERK